MEDPRIILQLILIVFIRCDAVNPGCECLLYSATYGKEYGTFSSPDYPRPYPPSVNCLLYTFVATKEEIIEITFKDFDVQKTHLDCMRGDFLKLFLHVDNGEVNEYTPWSGLLCGGYSDVPRVLYSSGPALVLEFHTDHVLSNSTGFIGTFRFIDRRMFQSDGQKLSGTLCDHQFISSNHSLSHGRFYSPRYPSSYPKNIRCAYRFRARSKERIKILFEEVTLQKGDVSCLNRGDVIKVNDGRSGISPTISVLCNEASGLEVLSTGPDLYIEFVANSESPGQGFKAAFQFQPIDPETSNELQQTETTKYVSVESVGTSTQMHRHSTDPGPLVSATSHGSTREDMSSTSADGSVTTTADTQDNAENATTSIGLQEITTAPPVISTHRSRIVVCPQASSCDLSVDSDTVKNGTFTSPAYPNPYPPRSHCRYDFQGRGKERIQITFTDFYLFHPAEESDQCEVTDSLMAYVLIDGKMEKIDDFCGTSLPKPIMSNGPRFMLEFRGMFSSRSARGFKATYAFTENFGITTGQQLPDLPCAFSYNSSESRNGTFASPNFPGLYPRDTECHYFFQGHQHQRVRLHFNYFDVEGVTPCEATSASDYVEFSNFMARDRKHARYCGLLKEFDIESDRKFFRVTFRSNDRLDGTGFNGTYEFVDNVDTVTPAKPAKNNSEAFLYTEHCKLFGGLLLLLLYTFC